MRYEHTPRPEVEQHPHIRELIESQDKRINDRTYHRDKQKEKEEREGLIKDAKLKEVKEFWCEVCKEDIVSETFKEVEIDWSCPTQNIAFYRTKCFKGHWCIRFITDRHKDPYWFKSRKVAYDRGKHGLEVIQPFETNYNLLYGKR